MERNSFVFYKDWREAIKDLPNDIRLEIYESIIEYATTGYLPELKPMAKVAFNFIKSDLDRNFNKYQQSKNKKSESGRLGNLKRWNVDLYKEVISNKMTLDEAEMIAKDRTATNEIANVAVNVNDNVNVNDISSTNVLLHETASQPHVENIDYKELVNWFNETTKGVFGVLRYPLSDKRKSSIRARIREHGKDVFCDAIHSSLKSDYLKGSGGRGWKATFDWMIKPTNFEKIISGNYVNNNIGNNQGAGLNEDFARNIAEGCARADFEKRQ